MRKFYLTLALSSTTVFATGSPSFLPDEWRPEKCGREESLLVYTSDFRWGYSLTELLDRGEWIYNSLKRLPQRAYFAQEAGEWKLPYIEDRGGDVRMPIAFFRNVRTHIEQSLKHGYADEVFYSDLGHSHFLIPNAVWHSMVKGLDQRGAKLLVEDMLAEPELRILYHSSEQLAMRDADGNLGNDPRIIHRYHARNIVGDNKGGETLDLYENPESLSNTLSKLDGYAWHSGFGISASRDGCFAFRDRDGTTKYFDISLFDPEPGPDVDVY